MNKIFKTKYDVTTGQTKVVSELAKNCQVASRSENKPKCGGISGNFLGLFKLLPLAFLLTGSFVYGQDINIVLSGFTADEAKIGPDTILNDKGGSNKVPFIGKVGDKSIILAPGSKSLIFKRKRDWKNAGEQITIDTDNWMRIRETVIIGHRARSNGNKAVAIGEQAFANKEAVSLGSEAIAYGSHTVALGMQSYAEQTDDISLGHRAYAKGSQSTALGAHSSVESQKAVAIGYNARVDNQHTDAIALGAESEADSPSSSFMITKDDKSEAKEKTWISEEFAKKFEGGKLGGALSIGKKDTKYRQIVNVAPGTEDTHAVNLGQLREAMKNAGGGGVSYFSVNKLTAMQNKDNMGAKANHSLAIGVAETEMSKGMYSIVIGTANDDGTNTGSGNSQFTKSSGKAAVAIGSIATVEADYGIALGKMAKIHTSATAAIALGKGAEAKVAGAVAIGESAVVETAAGDSVALGKNSKAKDKKNAFSTAEITVGKNSLKFEWKGGISKNGQFNSVVSVGDVGSERIITNVAAGKIDASSTDAINGSQLDSVIRVFGKLGTDILGAEVNDKKEFTKTTFTKLKDATKKDDEVVAQMTFKGAIEESIKTINKGLKFKGDTNGSGNGDSQQLYLGSTLTITGAKGDASSPATSAVQNGATNTHQNIFTKTSKDTLEIALNKDLKGISTISGQQGTSGNGSAVAKIEFNSTASGGNGSTPNVKITAGTGAFTFGKDGLDLGNKQITKLRSGLEVNSNGGSSGTSNIENVLNGNLGSNGSNISNNAVNVKDLSDIAKALVEKGLKFAVEDGSTTQPSAQNGKTPVTRKLGETLTFKGDKYLILATENGSGSNGGKITFKLNVANSIDTNGQGMSDTTDGNKLVTVSAVKNYLKTQLDSLTLKIEADNSNTAQAQPQPPQPSGTPSASGQPTSGKVQAEVKLRSQALQVLGTTDEIETAVEDKQQKVTLKLAKKVTDKLEIIQLSNKADDDSFALGKNSKLETARKVFKTTDINVGKNSLTFTWNSGISKKDGKFNSVVSVGNTGAERIITHVAAGSVMSGSTDAINGGQLYGVIEVFGKLGTDILGAKVDDQTKTFKAPTFAKLKDENGDDKSVKAAATFKDAIDKNIETINKGLIFEVDSSTTTSTDQAGSTTANKMTRQLGATIKLKGDDYIKPSIDANTGTISFKIEATEDIKEDADTEDKKLTTAGAVKKFVKNKIQTIADKQAEADEIAVKYDSKTKDTITLGGTQTSSSTSSPVAIKNLKSGLGLDNGTQDQPMGQDKTLELVKKLVAEGMSGQQGQQMTKDELHKAANLADLKAVAQAGLSFAGNDKIVHRKLSDTLIIKGEENSDPNAKFNSNTTAAGNIKVETNKTNDGLEIKLSDTLKNMKAFETKEESGKKSTLNSDGLTVTDKTATATYGAKGLTVKGVGGEIKIDGEKGIITVPDIKPTTTGSAVVNKNYVDGKNNELRTQLNNTDRNLRAGIAGANAAAGLTSVSMPGKSMLAISAAGYGGENAMAIGYSRMSDNGKIMLKFQGNRNSQGKMAGSVSIGYQW
ncbi:YadA-like family protein [Histophilus somni]|uniref:YadA-like family protein n=1 Tax=Histophilus somni TaxID=731 RepID=UPI003877A8E0